MDIRQMMATLIQEGFSSGEQILLQMHNRTLLHVCRLAVAGTDVLVSCLQYMMDLIVWLYMVSCTNQCLVYVYTLSVYMCVLGSNNGLP